MTKRKNEAEWNRLDAYTLEFHQRVRKGYLEMAAAEPERWRVVDAGGAFEDVLAKIREMVVMKLA